jgi:gas vesicle protein
MDVCDSLVVTVLGLVSLLFKKREELTMSAGKFFLGVVIGMATGAALGVLFAPDKGTTTRKKLSKQGGALIETASDYVDNLEEKLDGVREAAVGLGDKVKGAVDSLTALSGSTSRPPAPDRGVWMQSGQVTDVKTRQRKG